MQEIISLFFIGISLSMDAFSISLSIGMNTYLKRKIIYFCILVGILHFFMPIFGFFIRNNIFSFIIIESKILLSIILFFIALDMLISFKNKKNPIISTNYLTLSILALIVSLDSFATGLGLNAITNNCLFAGFIFSLCSFSISFLGTILGKQSKNITGKYSNLIGCIILLIISFLNLLS